MHRLINIFVVVITLFAASAPCFCWVQTDSMPGCHAAVEMEDCCCSRDATVDHEMPVRDLAVLPAEWQIPQLNSAILAAYNVSFVSDHASLPVRGRDRGGSLRSPPDLYLLHASFLI